MSGARTDRAAAARSDARKATRFNAKRKAKAGNGKREPDYGVWPDAQSYAVAKRSGRLVTIPEPRSGFVFVNANCDCWRRQFSNLFCAKCVPSTGEKSQSQRARHECPQSN
jgi:hypothetical protein